MGTDMQKLRSQEDVFAGYYNQILVANKMTHGQLVNELNEGKVVELRLNREQIPYLKGGLKLASGQYELTWFTKENEQFCRIKLKSGVKLPEAPSAKPAPPVSAEEKVKREVAAADRERLEAQKHAEALVSAYTTSITATDIVVARAADSRFKELSTRVLERSKKKRNTPTASLM